jgi:signal transduction histidine kinase
MDVSYSIESSAVISPAQPSHALLEVNLTRKLMQVVTRVSNEQVLLEAAEILAEALGAAGCIIAIQSSTQLTPYLWLEPSQLDRETVLAAYSAIAPALLQQPEGSQVRELNPPLCASLGIATRFQGQINGVICLIRGTEGALSHPWVEADGATLANIADLIAMVIAQVLSQQRITQQGRYQALVRQLTQSIQETMDLPQILKFAAEGTAQALNADRALVLRLKFWDPRHSLRVLDRIPKARVIIDSEWNRLGRLEESEEAPVSQSFWIADCGLCQSAMTSVTKSLAFADRAEIPKDLRAKGIAPIFDSDQMAALLLVPLESKNRLLGFIVMQQQTARQWYPEEIELVELVAGQISSAILQTETLRQVESLVEERTSQLQQSLELQAKLYDMTRKQIDKLREMNQRMDEFLSTLSHELRTPLTSMMLAIRMLRQADLPPERRMQYLNILEQQCVQETNLVNDLLALQELETKQVAFQFQQVHLQQVVEDVVQSFSQRWSLKGLQLELDLPTRSPVFNTDLASLNRILLELFTNAGKYADPNSAVRLQVKQQPGQQVQIALSNLGSGISEEELPHIFDKFRRCQGMTQNAVPGTGLGLALVKSLVQHLNGDITATSEPTEDAQSFLTSFVVTLPQNLEIGKE